MDFALYHAALNRRLRAVARQDADEQRARQYFSERLPIEQASQLEMIEQDLQAMDDDAGGRG